MPRARRSAREPGQNRRNDIPLFWIISIVALWVLVLLETLLLLQLLRVLGQMKQQGAFMQTPLRSSEEWGLAVGEPAPSFGATDYEGRPVQLADFQGQRRILAFILPGCAACDGTMKALVTFARQEQTAVILVIGGSDRERNRAYALEHETPFTILTPTPAFSGELYRLGGVPFVFVIDEAGIIRAKGVANTSERLQHLFTAAFALPLK
jgi:methylamine dehydrogenase accessory protein MauD